MNHTSRQKGSILIVALVLMTILMFMAITSFQVNKGSIQIVNNAQQRAQGAAAAQEVIDRTISGMRFSTTPADAIINPCNGAPNTACVDNNGDGLPDVTVTIAPQCQSSQTISNASLNLLDIEDKGCALGVNQDFGTAGARTSSSMCANTLWEIEATAANTKTRTKVVTHQGVAIRTGAAGQVCP